MRHDCLLVRLVVLTLLTVWLGAPDAQAARTVEDFGSTALEDPTLTTAEWDTVRGELRLPAFSLESVGVLSTASRARDVVVRRSLAFVADGSAGLAIHRVDDVGAPTLLAQSSLPRAATGLDVVGARAYVADALDGLMIFDVSDPTLPILVGGALTPGTPLAIKTVGSTAFVADDAAGLTLVDVALAGNEQVLRTVATVGPALDVTIDRGRALALVATGSGGLTVIDVQKPATAAVIATLATPGDATGITIDGGYVFVSVDEAGLLVVDVTDPLAPTVVGSVDTPGRAQAVRVAQDRAFVADGPAGLVVVDIENPAAPSIREVFDTAARAVAVDVTPGHAFVADDAAGVPIVRIAALAAVGFEEEYPTGVGLVPVIVGDRVFREVFSDILKIERLALDGSLSPLGQVSIPGLRWFDVVDDMLFATANTTDLIVVDVSDPGFPAIVGTMNLLSEAFDIEVRGDHAFIASSAAGLKVVDVADPTSPAVVANAPALDGGTKVKVRGDLAYLFSTALDATLEIFDVSNPASPTSLSSLTGSGVAVKGSWVFTGRSGRIRIVDASDPANPTLESEFEMPSPSPTYIAELRVVGDLLFVAATDEDLRILDVSDPRHPVQLRSLEFPSDFTDGVVVGDQMGIVVHQQRLPGVGFSGLRTFRAFQDDVARAEAIGRSLSVSTPGRTIVRTALRSTSTDGVSFRLSVDGGQTLRSTVPDGEIVAALDEGDDLRWQADLTWSAELDPGVDEVSIDWWVEGATVLEVQDVPQDQGGRVDLTFDRSGFDFAGETATPISGYNVYRQVESVPVARAGTLDAALPDVLTDGATMQPLTGADLSRVEGHVYASGASLPFGTWKVVATVFATNADTYTVEVATDSDGSPSTFLVTAHTTTPSIWFASPTADGTSTDDIAPGVPSALVATVGDEAVSLDWADAPEDDFQFHRIYRSTSADFVPNAATLRGETVDSAFDDVTASLAEPFYRVTTLDAAGNESASALVEVDAATGAASSRRVFALDRARPNPFNPTTRLTYEVGRAGTVQMTVHDLAGRRVRTLVRGWHAAGRYESTWNGRDDAGRTVASGTYLVRLERASDVRTRRVTLVK